MGEMPEKLPELSHRAVVQAATRRFWLLASAVVILPTTVALVAPGVVEWIAKGHSESAFDAATGGLFVYSVIAAVVVLMLMLIVVAATAHWAYAKRVVSAHNDRIGEVEQENARLTAAPRGVQVLPGGTYIENYHSAGTGHIAAPSGPDLWLPRGIEPGTRVRTTEVQVEAGPESPALPGPAQPGEGEQEA